MPNNPKLNGEKIASVLKAWKDVCPTKSFAGMTLVQFTAKVQPSLDARDRLDTLADQTTAAETDRDNADVESIKQVNLVVNAIKGDPTEGEDGELYAAMGYVRKSDRSTGKTNKSKPQPAGAAAH
jgi:hypothetical protein